MRKQKTVLITEGNPPTTSEPLSCNKEAYESDKAATAAIADCQARGYTERQRAYQCKLCNKWHTTTKEGKLRSWGAAKRFAK